MATIEHEASMKTNFGMFDDGCVWITAFANSGDNDTCQRMNQDIVLDVKQSKDLYEQLKEHFGDATDDEANGLLDHLYDDTTLPEEPEEEGLYATQNGMLVSKNRGDWSYSKYPYKENASWRDEYAYEWEDDWKVVVETLGDDAFPLKHITISDMRSIAAQQPCDPANIGDELKARLDALHEVMDKAATRKVVRLIGNLAIKPNIEE